MADFTFTRGDTVEFSCTATLGGEPYDLTGAQIFLTAKRQFVDDDEDAIFQKTIGNGITIVNITNGLFTCKISPADTASLSQVKTVLHYDIEIIDSDGEIWTSATGKFIISPDVTIGS